jgi:hypothetical protein
MLAGRSYDVSDARGSHGRGSRECGSPLVKLPMLSRAFLTAWQQRPGFDPLLSYTAVHASRLVEEALVPRGCFLSFEAMPWMAGLHKAFGVFEVPL